jgi:GDP-L-fucose synthase
MARMTTSTCNFDDVLPALIRKVHEALAEWSQRSFGMGQRDTAPRISSRGRPRGRTLSAQNDSPEIVNIGCGEDVTIRELAETVCEVIGFEGPLFSTPQNPMALLESS